jgi:hypothetical protein
MAAWLDHFCSWLESTPLSQTLQTEDWIVPAVQTLHILSIGLVLAAVLMLNLRLLNLACRDQPVTRIAARFLPVVWWTLPVLLVTGLLMIVAEPARSLENSAFQLKMVLLLSIVTLTFAVQKRIDTNRWSASSRLWHTGFPLLSLLLWVGVVFAGRWIAYVRVA